MANPRFVMRKYVGPRADDIPVGGRYIGDFGGRQVGILNVDGAFYAFLHRCPHLGGPLCEGAVLGLVSSTGPGELDFDADRKMLTCPWHGWEFDLKTGQSYWNPRGLRARTMPVQVQHGSQVATEIEDGSAVPAIVPGPYVAETYAVTVESDYVVVSIRERATEPVDRPPSGADEPGKAGTDRPHADPTDAGNTTMTKEQA